LTGAAPGRVGSGFVDERAQHVARGDDLFGRDLRLARGLLELADAVDQSRLDLRGVGLCRDSQLRDEIEQRRGGRHQRIEADGVGQMIE
jgi:hypothetical protein